MRKHFIPLVLAAPLALSMVACSSSSDQAAPVTSVVTVTATPTAEDTQTPAPPAATTTVATAETETPEKTGGFERSPDNKIIGVKDLETVRVPALCGNEAGDLVGGVLPAELNESGGPAELVRRDDGTPMGGFTDVNGDGKDEAVLVYNCNMGGVSWPDNLLFYDNDLNLTHWEESFGDPEFTPLGKNVTDVTWDSDSVQVTTLGWKEGDPSCCASQESVMEVTVGGTITFETKATRLSTRSLR